MKKLLIILCLLATPVQAKTLYQNDTPKQVKPLSVNTKMLIAEGVTIATQHSVALAAGRPDLVTHYWITRATIAGLRTLPVLKNKPVTTAVLGVTIISCKEFFDKKFDVTDILFGNIPAGIASYRELKQKQVSAKVIEKVVELPPLEVTSE